MLQAEVPLDEVLLREVSLSRPRGLSQHLSLALYQYLSLLVSVNICLSHAAGYSLLKIVGRSTPTLWRRQCCWGISLTLMVSERMENYLEFFIMHDPPF